MRRGRVRPRGGGEFGASGRGSPGVERFDEFGHHAAALLAVLLRVAADDPLVGAVRELERLVGGVVEQEGGALPLFVGPQGLGRRQHAPSPGERVVPGAAPAGAFSLEPAAHGGEPVAREPDDVERVQYLHGVGDLAAGGLLVSGNASIATAFTASRNDWVLSASHRANVFSLLPSTMFRSLAGRPRLLGVRSTMTVTYRLPCRVCRHTCSSTPTVSTPSRRCGSHIYGHVCVRLDTFVGGVPGHTSTIVRVRLPGYSRGTSGGTYAYGW